VIISAAKKFEINNRYITINMKLSTIKNHLSSLETVRFRLPDGNYVASHFHITEIGMITRQLIDCGGNMHTERSVSFQLWHANDTDHQLEPQKLLKIIAQSEKALGLDDLEIEVEYQAGTIGKYGLVFDGTDFLLTSTRTDCRAKEGCGVPDKKKKVKLSELTAAPCCSTTEKTCC
jgi:hypothetical protein